ncbi:MAG: hypothetical protein ACJ8D5_07485 [Sphingomicrobium sp.]
MENDSVRSSGRSTLVDIWIDGKLRSISVSAEAIEAHLRLPADRAAAMTDDDRRDFVRNNLAAVVTAATNWLRSTNPDADTIPLEDGQLGGEPRPRAGEPRNGDRRKGDRRKLNLGPPPSGERRR